MQACASLLVSQGARSVVLLCIRNWLDLLWWSRGPVAQEEFFHLSVYRHTKTPRRIVLLAVEVNYCPRHPTLCHSVFQ